MGLMHRRADTEDRRSGKGEGACGGWVNVVTPASVGGDCAESDGEGPALRPHKIHPRLASTGGVLAGECSSAVSRFFQARRAGLSPAPAPLERPPCDKHPGYGLCTPVKEGVTGWRVE
jgi:hypothetical protein|uniref:Uncharacterized protein n=1 Tax=Prasinoderma singulare TaxID=676789 RepID=A0A7S3BXQ6_9VIRI|mmetsp:Transcript_3991/g.12503  ORF Transcript_3991/g.12503 Transcript_3991/m.12503 type:complete len:118 (-) Transcript_3991:63-416(-)